MGEYMHVQFSCETHLATVISADEPMMVFRYDSARRTYEIDQSNMYCTAKDEDLEADPEHKFVMNMNTSDGVSLRIPIPEPR